MNTSKTNNMESDFKIPNIHFGSVEQKHNYITGCKGALRVFERYERGLLPEWAKNYSPEFISNNIEYFKECLKIAESFEV